MNARFKLPAHLTGLTRIVVDPGLENEPLLERVKNRLPLLPVSLAEPVWRPESEQGGLVLYLKNFQGAFIKPCPATREYRCCGYGIVHVGENCPLSCSYCILQAYFRDRVLKVWANQGDLWRELERTFGANPEQRFRVGTGEFTDSLALEAVTGFASDLVERMGEYPNAVLELKSKIIDLSWIPKVKDPRRVLPAWSLNAQQIVAEQEKGAASLEERLSAARTCAGQGFRVCLHFDPVILYPGWEAGYDQTVDMIFDYLKPEQICYLSLGSFRFMPDLAEEMARRHPEARYLWQGEFVRGLDGKRRLLRPLRVRQLARIAARLRNYGLARQIYLCMESDEVWREVLMTTPPDFGGLEGRLMELAFSRG